MLPTAMQPEGWQAKLIRGSSVWITSVACWDLKSHKRSDLSAETEANASAVHFKAFMLSEWPLRVISGSFEEKDHILQVLSMDPEASRFPSKDQAQHLILSGVEKLFIKKLRKKKRVRREQDNKECKIRVG